jgi:hypothetical protein
MRSGSISDALLMPKLRGCGTAILVASAALVFSGCNPFRSSVISPRGIAVLCLENQGRETLPVIAVDEIGKEWDLVARLRPGGRYFAGWSGSSRRLQLIAGPYYTRFFAPMEARVWRWVIPADTVQREACT